MSLEARRFRISKLLVVRPNLDHAVLRCRGELGRRGMESNRMNRGRMFQLIRLDRRSRLGVESFQHSVKILARNQRVAIRTERDGTNSARP